MYCPPDEVIATQLIYEFFFRVFVQYFSPASLYSLQIGVTVQITLPMVPFCSSSLCASTTSSQGYTLSIKTFKRPSRKPGKACSSNKSLNFF